MRFIGRNESVAWFNDARLSMRRPRVMRRQIRGMAPLLLIVAFLALATISVRALIGPASWQLENFPAGP